jgi:hypothetical protein
MRGGSSSSGSDTAIPSPRNRTQSQRVIMTRWNLSIQDETDRLVRVFLARAGLKKGDLSAFVEAACRREVLRRTVAEFQEENKGLSADDAMRRANEAVAATRAART